MIAVKGIRESFATARVELPPRKEEHPKPSWSAVTYFLVGLAVAIGALGILPLLFIHNGGAPDSAWGLTIRLGVFVGSLVAMFALMIAVGIAVTEQRMGVLWTSRNAYSLPRVQAAMWTLLVIGGIAAVVVCRSQGLMINEAERGLAGALNLEIPPAILAVLGISLGSGAAASAILSVKSRSAPVDTGIIRGAASRTGTDVGAVGNLIVRPDSYKPLIRDIFQSDNIANAGTVDIGKLQQVMVTLILWCAYFAMLTQLFVSGGLAFKAGLPPATALPPMSETFVYLLGISHAGYLAYQAAPSSPTAGTGQANAPAAPSQVLPRPLPPRI